MESFALWVPDFPLRGGGPEDEHGENHCSSSWLYLRADEDETSAMISIYAVAAQRWGCGACSERLVQFGSGWVNLFYLACLKSSLYIKRVDMEFKGPVLVVLPK